MNCHVEWIRNFLLRKSTVSSDYASRNNYVKSSTYGKLSSLRFQLLKPGFNSFIDHTFYSITISIIDSGFSYENSNFSVIRSYLLQYLPSVDVSINELEGRKFSSSHYSLCKSILNYYIRFYLKPSTISPTCFGLDIDAYEKSLYEWGRSICKSEIPYLPGNFMIDFGTAQVISIILSKIYPELIHLNQITFSERLDQSEIIRNWREVGTALNAIGVHVPTEREWGDNLCLLCFGVDLFRAIYNKPKSSDLVEFQMKQNQINQQKNYQTNNNLNYCATNEINKIDFLIGQINSISKGNPNVLLSEPFQQNPILVQQQLILQQQQHQQQLLQIQQQQQQQQLLQIQHDQISDHFNQPETINYQRKDFQPNSNYTNSRVKVVSTPKKKIYSDQSESTERKTNIDDELLYRRAEKYKLLKGIKSSATEKQNENKSNKSPQKSKENDQRETIQNFKIMSSFAIDPSFPNQCKLTTYKEAIDNSKKSKSSQNFQLNENQFKKLQKFDKFENNNNSKIKKKKKNELDIPHDPTVKCSYVTFDNNRTDQISSQNLNKENSKRSKKHHNKSAVIQRNSLFDDVIEADKPGFQNPKSSHEFQNLISKQKDEFKGQLSPNKSGTDLLTSINSFIEQQREAIAAASLAKKIEHSKSGISEPLPDFTQFDVSKPESMKIFDTDPILLINSQKKDKVHKDNRNHKKNAKNLTVTSPNENDQKSSKANCKSSSSSSSFSSFRSGSQMKSNEKENTQNEGENNSPFPDPLIEITKSEQNSKTNNNNNDDYDPFRSSSYSSSKAKSTLSSGSKKSKKIEYEKTDSFNNSMPSQKVNIDKLVQPKTDHTNDSNLELNESGLKSSSIKSDEVKYSEKNESELVQPDRNENESISQMKNLSKIEDFSMKSELTFPDIPSLIDQSFRFDQQQSHEKAKNLDHNSCRFASNKLNDSSSLQFTNQGSNKMLQNSSKLQVSGMNSTKLNNKQNSSKLQVSGMNSSKLNNNKNSSDSQISEQNSNKSLNSERDNSKIRNSSKPLNINSQQNSSDLSSSEKDVPKNQNINSTHNSSQQKLSDSSSLERGTSKYQSTNIIHNSSQQKLSDSSSSERDTSKNQNINSTHNSSQQKLSDLPNSDNSSSKFHHSDNDTKASAKKRPIPVPPSPPASSTNFASSSSKLPFSFKSNGQKSDSLTPAELSIVSGLEGDLINSKHDSDSMAKPPSKSLHDDNELSIDQNSSEIRHNGSNSNANSDSFGQSTIKKINVPSSESKLTNSILENSQSSTKVESAVEDFIPEIEKASSGGEQKSKTNKNEDIKRFHSSSSSSDSIPFKVLHSDSDKNQIENRIIKQNEEDKNEEDSKPFTSVIEEFDLSSIKQKKSKNQIQSISGPIKLNNEPVINDNKNKGPNSETRRVSFSLGVKGFLPPQSLVSSTNAKKKNSSTNSSINFDNNDVDTFMSTASLSHSLSIPVEERLKMYSKDHNELSLSLSEAEPEIILEYRDVSTANVGKKFIWLSNDEQALLESILPTVISNSDITDITSFLSKELKMPKNNSSVHRIAANIKAFIISREKKQ